MKPKFKIGDIIKSHHLHNIFLYLVLKINQIENNDLTYTLYPIYDKYKTSPNPIFGYDSEMADKRYDKI
jgi:hypothetical protein